MKVPFNKPFIVGNELDYVREAVDRGHLTGNGAYSKRCHQFFEQRYGMSKCLLTTSCTDALEMSAILSGIKSGDEVIVPAFTFVSTANAFVLRGAKVVFAESGTEHPNMDVNLLESLITKRTKVIVVVHYAGVAVDMDPVMQLAKRYGIQVVEDAAQAIESSYKGKALGSIGDFSTFSFHETKNVISGEGGLLAINQSEALERAEIIWEKGTNRAAFFRGDVDKYQWVDIGSSFLPSEMTAAFLWAQLENIERIQDKRKSLWKSYREALADLDDDERLSLPMIPDYATNNAHMFYLVTDSLARRDELIRTLRAEGFHAVFHYQSLHRSPYYAGQHDGRDLIQADRYSDCLLRLPLFYELKEETTLQIASVVRRFFTEVKA